MAGLRKAAEAAAKTMGSLANSREAVGATSVRGATLTVWRIGMTEDDDDDGGPLTFDPVTGRWMTLGDRYEAIEQGKPEYRTLDDAVRDDPERAWPVLLQL